MNNLYAVAPYFVAKVLVAIPVELGPLFIGNTIGFWALKLNHSVEHYLVFLAFACSMSLSSVGLGFMLAAATGGNAQAASAAVGPVALIFLLLGGFYINVSTIPVWIAWLSKLNYVSWAYEGLAINQFNGLQVGDDLTGTAGTSVLNDLFNGAEPRSESEWEGIMWVRLLYLVIGIAVFNFLGYIMLLFKGPKYLQLTQA